MTTVASINDLLQRVVSDCPGASDDLVLKTIKESMLDFCTRSGIWTEEIVITTVEDQANYALTSTETDAVIHRILSVKYTDSDGDQSSCVEDQNKYDLDLTNQELVWRQDWIPGVDDYDYTVKVQLVPEWRASTFPTWMLNRWGLGIQALASAEILLKPGPWQDAGGKWVGLEQRRRREYHAAWIGAENEAKRLGTQRRNSIQG